MEKKSMQTSIKNLMHLGIDFWKDFDGFWDQLGRLLGSKFGFFSIFFLVIFWHRFGIDFFRYFVDFGPLESLILVLPLARELNFHKIHVLGFINKFGPTMLVLRF